MKKIKMPAEFEVFGQRVTITYHENPLIMEDGRIAYGVYYKDTNHIDIGPHQSKDELVKSLVHELGHGLLDRLGLWQTSMHSDLHEIIVEAYSRFIFENFKMKALTSKPKLKPRPKRKR